MVIIAGAEADAHAHYMCGLSAAAGVFYAKSLVVLEHAIELAWPTIRMFRLFFASICTNGRYCVGAFAMAGIPVLCFTDTEDSATVLASDRRMTVQGLCASAEEYGTTIRRFISTAS